MHVQLDVPVGTVIDFAGREVPPGYLECDGRAVSRAAYPLLFEALGTLWGAGDGSATFNLPDLRGRASIGAGTGTAGGATEHALASYGGDERAQSHSHTVPAHGHGFTNPDVPKHGHGFTQPTVNGGSVANGITGGSHSHNVKINSYSQTAPSGSYQTCRYGATFSSNAYVIASTHTHTLPAHTHAVSGGAVADRDAFATTGGGVTDKAAFQTESSGGGLPRTCSPSPRSGRPSARPDGRAAAGAVAA